MVDIWRYNQLNKLPTHERLKEALWYCPDTGRFVWLISRPKIVKGTFAGNTKNSRVPYILIGLDGKQYYAHRLAWLYMTGKEPKEMIDHKDGNGLNNKWLNLREANKSQNARNCKVKSNSKSGVKGISKNRKGYLVKVCLGTYSTMEEALEVYNKAISQFYGDFARLSENLEVQPIAAGNA